MSYDLNFWRYADEAQPRSQKDHVQTYRDLCAGNPPAGLVELPAGAVRGKLDETFADWTPDSLGWEKGGVIVELTQTDHWVRFDLRGPWNGDHANPLIDVMAAFGCPLFDPQTGERFRLG